MKTDVSIHFTIKDQTVEELNNKLVKYIDENNEYLNFDFSERTEPRSVLHHCFLPEKMVIEKGFSTDIYEDILHPTSEYKICWFGVSGCGLELDRKLMLENLAKLNGLSIFVGEIKDGVLEEFKLVKELGIEYIHIS